MFETPWLVLQYSNTTAHQSTCRNSTIWAVKMSIKLTMNLRRKMLILMILPLLLLSAWSLIVMFRGNAFGVDGQSEFLFCLRACKLARSFAFTLLCPMIDLFFPLPLLHLFKPQWVTVSAPQPFASSYRPEFPCDLSALHDTNDAALALAVKLFSSQENSLTHWEEKGQPHNSLRRGVKNDLIDRPASPKFTQLPRSRTEFTHEDQRKSTM